MEDSESNTWGLPAGMPAGLAVTSDDRARLLFDRILRDPTTTVEQLAREFRLSPSRLEHLFKSTHGACLRTHLVNSRMNSAADLLRTTRLSVKEIAHKLGYAHPPSFVRTFTRLRGQSPQRFRHALEIRVF